MRHLLVYALIAFATVGCALTPQEVREAALQYQFTSPHPLDQVAACLARNAENADGSLHSAIRSGAAPGTIEVIVRGREATAFAVADFASQSGSTSYTIWITPRMLAAADRDWFAALLAKDC